MKKDALRFFYSIDDDQMKRLTANLNISYASSNRVGPFRWIHMQMMQTSQEMTIH